MHPPLPLPPGPSLWAFAGRMLGGGTERLLPMLEEVQRQHGDVVRLPTPYKPTIVMAHPDAIAHVLQKNAGNYRKDWVLRSHLEVFGEGLLTAEGKSWLTERRLLQPQFHKLRIEGYARAMVALTERAVARWADGVEIDAQAEMMQLTLEIVVKTLFDLETTERVRATGAALEGLLEHYRAVITAVWPLPAWVPTGVNRRYRKAVAALRAIVEEIVAARLRTASADQPRAADLLQMLLDARDSDGAGLTRARVCDELLTFLVAGHETTAQTLSFTWHLLAQAPEARQRLGAELRDVIGDRSPEPADLARLPFLAAVLKESMRLFPAAPNLGREAIAEDAVLGHRIPAGATALLSSWLVQRDARYYEAPLEFRPQRWLGDLESRLPRFAYLPFGGGNRQCIGNAFALMEAKLILACIASRFELAQAPGTRLRLLPSITLRSADGVRMRLRAVA